MHLPTCVADIKALVLPVGPNYLDALENKLKAMRQFEKKVSEQEAHDGDDEVTTGQPAEDDEDEYAEGGWGRMDTSREKAIFDFEKMKGLTKKRRNVA